MRRAFALLEVILALFVFCIVILVCSQMFFEVSKSLKIYKEHEISYNALNNAVLKIRRFLRYGMEVKFKDQKLEFFIPNMLFSSSPIIVPQRCEGNTIFLQNFLPSISFVLISGEISRVVSQDAKTLILDKELECEEFITMESIAFWIDSNHSLLFNHEVLLPNISRFDFMDQGQFYEMKICTLICHTFLVAKGGFYEEL